MIRDIQEDEIQLGNSLYEKDYEVFYHTGHDWRLLLDREGM